MDEITYEEIKDIEIMIKHLADDYMRLSNDMKILSDCLRPIMLKLPKEGSNVEHE